MKKTKEEEVVRIAATDIPARLSVYAGLTKIKGISWSVSNAICNILNIKTEISWSMDYNLIEGKTERLVELCKQAGATEYISGPAAKDYIDNNLFEEEGISLHFMDYSGYPEYNQLYPPFDHAVSIIDLIFNEGPDAQKYMKSF